MIKRILLALASSTLAAILTGLFLLLALSVLIVAAFVKYDTYTTTLIAGIVCSMRFYRLIHSIEEEIA